MATNEWPHDPDGEEGSEGMRKFGHAVIAKKVDEDEDFPLAKSEFVDEHGDAPIRLDYERVVSLRDVFDEVEEDEFDDLVAMHKAVGRAMRRAGMWYYEGSDAFVGTGGSA